MKFNISNINSLMYEKWLVIIKAFLISKVYLSLRNKKESAQNILLLKIENLTKLFYISYNKKKYLNKLL